MTTLNGRTALTVNLFHRGDVDPAKLPTQYATLISLPSALCLNFRAARSIQMTWLRIRNGRRVRRRRRVKQWEHRVDLSKPRLTLFWRATLNRLSNVDALMSS